MFLFHKLWLVIFPEGTRYNADKPEQKRQSQEFAKSRGVHSYTEHLDDQGYAGQLYLQQPPPSPHTQFY
jgi:1-acyl-sn-glycerol-3-phosphate acyltransferase